ncbi:MAG: oxaloacetate decarboxylase subunit alpha [Clostridiales bacterium]|nr:oxaloacetate decarboxylase subunit alpha [Clostridiales bacterium]
MKKVLITETILRDAHQSQAATRMKLSEMLPIAKQLDEVGYFSLEVWGGATFDSCLRFLNEDPWERLRQLRKAIPNTKLQMLFRGQNILGYKHYADDVVEKFVEMSVKNGIDIIRIFDALNDVKNLDTAIKATKKFGGICETAMSYTVSPVHDREYFINLAERLAEMGADIICIKDMANLLLPFEAYELVKGIKAKIGSIPVQLHTHNTSGTGDMTLLKAIEAGADIVDTALSPLGNGTSQPATEPLVATLKGTPYDTGLDLAKLSECASYFRKVQERLKKDGFLSDKVLAVDVNALVYQVPGGMLSNLISQLKQQGKEDKYYEVLEEVPRVRKDMGYPPLVTPTSQIVGTQAVLNVVAGERYKMVTKETKGVLKGEYGTLPAEPNKDVQAKILNGEQPITCRPADLLSPELDSYKNEIKEYIEQEEDVLSYALFPQVATAFFKTRQAAKYGVDGALADKKNAVHPV